MLALPINDGLNGLIAGLFLEYYAPVVNTNEHVFVKPFLENSLFNTMIWNIFPVMNLADHLAPVRQLSRLYYIATERLK
jgi:hypothetical protein